MNDVIARLTGKRVYDPTVRQWFDRWIDSEKSAISKATLERNQQIMVDGDLAAPDPHHMPLEARPRQKLEHAYEGREAIAI